MKIIKFYNTYHLGDTLFFIHFLNKLSLLYKDREFYFYCDKKYHDELNLWINNKDKIILEDLDKRSKDSIDCWVNKYKDFDNRSKFNLFYDKIYLSFYKKLCKELKIKNPIENSKKFLFDELQILTNNIKTTEKFDYLIINSKPGSHQWNYKEEDFNHLFEKTIDKNSSAITTSKNNYNFPCTLDYKMSLLDIATSSLLCKNIIGIHTAPHVPCINKWAINNSKYVFFHNEGIKYSYKNCQNNIDNSSKIKYFK